MSTYAKYCEKNLRGIESDIVEFELVYMLLSRKDFLVGGHLNTGVKEIRVSITQISGRNSFQTEFHVLEAARDRTRASKQGRELANR